MPNMLDPEMMDPDDELLFEVSVEDVNTDDTLWLLFRADPNEYVQAFFDVWQEGMDWIRRRPERGWIIRGIKYVSEVYPASPQQKSTIRLARQTGQATNSSDVCLVMQEHCTVTVRVHDATAPEKSLYITEMKSPPRVGEMVRIDSYDYCGEVIDVGWHIDTTDASKHMVVVVCRSDGMETPGP